MVTKVPGEDVRLGLSNQRTTKETSDTICYVIQTLGHCEA